MKMCISEKQEESIHLQHVLKPSGPCSQVTTEVYSFIGPEQRQVFEKHFKALDKNGNGEVSRDELQMRLFENATQKDLDLFVKVSSRTGTCSAVSLKCG